MASRKAKKNGNIKLPSTGRVAFWAVRKVGVFKVLLMGLALAAGFLWGTNYVKNRYDILN